MNSLQKAKAKSTAIAATVFLAPALILICVYMIYPVIDTFVTSVYKWNGISSDKIFIGMSNWNTLIHDSKFWASFLHNVVVMIFSILLLNNVSIDIATNDTEQCTLHGTVLLQVGHHLAYDARRHSEGITCIVASLRIDSGVDAHKFAGGIDECTT